MADNSWLEAIAPARNYNTTTVNSNNLGFGLGNINMPNQMQNTAVGDQSGTTGSQSGMMADKPNMMRNGDTITMLDQGRGLGGNVGFSTSPNMEYQNIEATIAARAKDLILAAKHNNEHAPRYNANTREYTAQYAPSNIPGLVGQVSTKNKTDNYGGDFRTDSAAATYRPNDGFGINANVSKDRTTGESIYGASLDYRF